MHTVSVQVYVHRFLRIGRGLGFHHSDFTVWSQLHLLCLLPILQDPLNIIDLHPAKVSILKAESNIINVVTLHNNRSFRFVECWRLCRRMKAVCKLWDMRTYILTQSVVGYIVVVYIDLVFSKAAYGLLLFHTLVHQWGDLWGC